MSNLDDILTSHPHPDRPGHRAIDIAAGWQQGRGTFGGLVIGALTRAITDAVGADLPLRTLTAQIPAPVTAGPASIEVEILRAGSAVTTATARLMQEGEVRAIAVGVCARARDGTAAVRWQADHPPTAPAWREVNVVPFLPGISPDFTKHLELRLVGPMPFSRAGAATILGWVGPREQATRRDAAYVAALADAYWPAALAVFGAPRPTATIAFTIELIEPVDDLDPAAPLLIRASSPAAQDGYTFETREVWGHDGRLVARNHQTFVIIK